MKQSEIARLEDLIRSLIVELRKLAEVADLEEAIRIIHNPGFTTPAEALMIVGIAEGALTQVRSASAFKHLLGAGIERVELNPQPLPP